ncbi:MAG: hypothetical protein J6Q51_00705, partial [Clostridia bacterium]|nr:hypothetical protein [Clostridia bacterium]
GTLTKLTILDLGVAEISNFGTGNTHENMQVWTKNTTTYTKVVETDSKSIGIAWEFRVDGGRGSFNYQLTIGTTVYTVSGSALQGQGDQYNTHLIVFPQTTDGVNVSLTTYFTGYPNENSDITGIQEQVSLALKGAGGTYTQVLGSSTDESYYNQYQSGSISSTFPVLGAEPVSINPGSQYRLRIYYTVMQQVRCFTENTLVTLADGTYKKIQDVGFDDLLMVYDFDIGKFGASYPVWIALPSTYDHYYIMYFDDGSTLEIVLSHRLFTDDNLDYEKSIDADYSSIGKKFPRQIMVDGVPKLTLTTCTNIVRVDETCTYYNMATSQAMNFLSNGFIGGPGVANIYTFDKIDDQTYVHNQDQLNHTKSGTTDIETGTMFPYEMFNTEIIPHYIYVAYRLAETRNMVNILKHVPPYNQINDDAIINALAISIINDYFEEEKFLENIEQLPQTCKVTFSDRINNKRYDKNSMFELPEPKVATNFVGWYNSFDGKLYQPGESAEIVINTHFIARYAA